MLWLWRFLLKERKKWNYLLLTAEYLFEEGYYDSYWHRRSGEWLIQQWLKGKDAKKWANWFKAQPKISSDVGFRYEASGDVKQNNSQ